MNRTSNGVTTLELSLTLKYQQVAEAFIFDKKNRDMTVWLGTTEVTSCFNEEELAAFRESQDDENEILDYEVDIECSGSWDPGCGRTMEDPGCPSSWEDLCADLRGIDIYDELTGKQQERVLYCLESTMPEDTLETW